MHHVSAETLATGKMIPSGTYSPVAEETLTTVKMIPSETYSPVAEVSIQ